MSNAWGPSCRHTGRAFGSPAFSLIELTIVLVILGVVAAIALPRMSRASSGAVEQTIAADIHILNEAVDTYAAEHDDRTPLDNSDGSRTSDTPVFVKRLTLPTNVSGSTSGTALSFGPYLRAVPVNPLNGLATLRIDGHEAPAGLAGWRYDSATRTFQSDAGTFRSVAIGSPAQTQND